MAALSFVRLGTRGSPLALWQAQWVAEALRTYHPDLHTEIVIIRTAGDRNRLAPLSAIGGKGLFVKDIEEALLQQEIDVAVHSLKDLPTELPAGLHLGAIPLRAEVRDAFVSRDGRCLTEEGRDWRIGTSSLRRRAQLLATYPQVQVQDIRGNVDTRLRKLWQGEVDALVVAAAGLIRLDKQDVITELLPVETMLPAVGQGALALETLEGHEVDTLLQPLHDPLTASAVTAERAFLHHLQGGCTVPVAAFAQCHQTSLHLQGLVASPDGTQQLRHAIVGPVAEAAQLGVRLAEHLRTMGAATILEALRH